MFFFFSIQPDHSSNHERKSKIAKIEVRIFISNHNLHQLFQKVFESNKPRSDKFFSLVYLHLLYVSC